MKPKGLEYFSVKDNGREEYIGDSGASPGMLGKLLNHDIATYEYSTIRVRLKGSGELVQTIEPHDGPTQWPC